MVLLDEVERILDAAKGPVHIDPILEGLVNVGAIPDAELKMKNKVYTTIMIDYNRSGEDSRFRRTGRGMFCLAKHFDPSSMTVKKAVPIKDRPGKAEREERQKHSKGVPVTERTCGNCKHIEYNGMQLASLSSGACNNYEVSRRCGVQSSGQACDGWTKRTLGQHRQDHAQQNETIMTINAYNSGKRPPKKSKA